MSNHIYICLPAVNEAEYISGVIECIKNQSLKDYTLIVCVNQPDSWWESDNKIDICHNNAKTLDYLRSLTGINIQIIDKSSKGLGWTSRDHGVGIARKTVMDTAVETASDNDIILSIDADTFIEPSYLESIRKTLDSYSKAAALSAPYYHKLTGKEREDRAILRYEIYMRNYAINMYRIKSPYNFTALGSGIALRVKAYKAIGGMTPKKSGEDFYFLQKLRKYGEILNYNPQKIYPAARFSNRVFFGTGPAMIKGDSGNWESYPIYHHTLFDQVRQTYEQFPVLYESNTETPMSDYLREVFKTKNLWQPLRENFTSTQSFTRACHNKVDALRVLQFLKHQQKQIHQSDEENLKDFLIKYYSEDYLTKNIIKSNLSFSTSALGLLDDIRNFLTKEEDQLRFSEYKSLIKS